MNVPKSVAGVKAAFLRKRSANWNHAETMELLLGYAEFKSGKKRRGRSTLFRLYEHLYSQKNAFKSGPKRSITQIRVKLDNLKAIYRDKCAKEQTDWPYYSLCQSIWGGHASKGYEDSDQVETGSAQEKPFVLASPGARKGSDSGIPGDGQSGGPVTKLYSRPSSIRSLLSPQQLHPANDGTNARLATSVSGQLSDGTVPLVVSDLGGSQQQQQLALSKQANARFNSYPATLSSSASATNHQHPSQHTIDELQDFNVPYSLEEPMVERMSSAARLSHGVEGETAYSYSPTSDTGDEGRPSSRSVHKGSDSHAPSHGLSDIIPEDLTMHKNNKSVAGYRMPFRQLVVAARDSSKPHSACPPGDSHGHVQELQNKELSPLGSSGQRQQIAEFVRPSASSNRSRASNKLRIPASPTHNKALLSHISLYMRQTNSLLQKMVRLEERKEKNQAAEMRLQREHELKMVETMGQYVCKAVAMMKGSAPAEEGSHLSQHAPLPGTRAPDNGTASNSNGLGGSSPLSALAGTLPFGPLSRAPSP